MRQLRLLVVLIAILWLASGLRFFRLDAQSFWNDEGNSARLSERAVPLIIEGTASDIHPPLYYLLLHGWRQGTGESEFSLRAFSTFAGILLVAGTVALGLRLFGGKTLPALLAGLIAAVNPALIYYSQETRMYELLGLLAVLSTLCLWQSRSWLRGRHPVWPYAVGYLLAIVAGLYTHYFFPAVLLAHNFIVLLWLVAWRRHMVGPALRWAGMVATGFLAYLPWLPIFLRQAGGRPGDEGTALSFLGEAARWLAVGGTLEGSVAHWALVGFGLLLALGLIPWQRTAEAVTMNPNTAQDVTANPNAAEDVTANPNAAEAVTTNGMSPSLQSLIPNLSLLIIPVLFMLIAGTTRPAYFKFMVVAVPFLALSVGQGAARGWWMVRQSRGLRLPLLLLLLAGGGVALWATGRSLHNLYFDPVYARANYRTAAARIAREAHPNAGIILNAANQWEVFTYYHQEGAPVYPLPRGYLQRERIAADLKEIAERHDRVYALFWGEAERDPERLVERWLDEHAYKATEEWLGDVRFVTYAVPGEPATLPEMQANVHFGGLISLDGYTIRRNEIPAGEIVQVTLFWEAERRPEERYKVFLHLVDEKGQLVAQRDSEPGGGLALTTGWMPGETIVDNHGLFVPPATPPGRYTLRLGLYELADPTSRLPVSSGADDADFYSPGTVTILP